MHFFIDYFYMLLFYILYIVLFNSSSPRELTNDLERLLMDESDFEDAPSRKVIKNFTKKQKSSSQRFRWSSEMVEALLECLNDLKSQYQFKGLDFESDLIRLYQEVRTMMAKRYITGEFGPVAISEVEGDIEPSLHKKLKFSIKDFFSKYDQIRRKHT